jgi:hypothetical protein
MFFGRRFAYFQEPFPAAPMACAGKTNEREYKLIPTLLALPSPVAIHLVTTSPVISRERRPAATRPVGEGSAIQAQIQTNRFPFPQWEGVRFLKIPEPSR